MNPSSRERPDRADRWVDRPKGRPNGVVAIAFALAAAGGWLACGLTVVGSGASGARIDGGTTPSASTEPAGSEAGGPPEGGAPDGDAEPRPKSCTGHPGPAMVDLGPYCVDATEVTEAQYQQFLDSAPATGTGFCSWNTDYQPATACSFTPTLTGNRPVACIDWCDAAAFCAWAGKRLCGAIGGGKIVWNSPATVDAHADQWMNACSAGGARAYPYGTTSDAQKCNTEDHVPFLGGPVDVGSMSGCVGGFSGLFDMSGNVFEWEDSCEDLNGADDHCALRGGAYTKQLSEYGACSQADQNNKRNGRFVDVGFRCCSFP